LLALKPEWFLASVTRSGSFYAANWGPLYAPLVILPFYLAWAIAIVALAQAYWSAATPRLAIRSRTLLVGIGLFIASITSNYAAFYTGQVVLGNASGPNLLYALVFDGLALLVVWVVAGSFARARSRARPGPPHAAPDGVGPEHPSRAGPRGGRPEPRLHRRLLHHRPLAPCGRRGHRLRPPALEGPRPAPARGDGGLLRGRRRARHRRRR